MMKNCGGAFSAYLKMPSAAFRYFSNFLHLHLHYPLPSTFIQLPCVKKAGLRQGSLASDMIIFTDTNTVQIAHTLSAVKTEGLLPPTIPFPPSPPTALCPEIQIRAAGATIILHSSLFIIHHLLRLRQHHDSPLAFLLSVLRNISVPLISASVFKPEYLSCCARHNLLFDCFNYAKLAVLSDLPCDLSLRIPDRTFEKCFLYLLYLLFICDFFRLIKPSYLTVLLFSFSKRSPVDSKLFGSLSFTVSAFNAQLYVFDCILCNIKSDRRSHHPLPTLRSTQHHIRISGRSFHFHTPPAPDIHLCTAALL